MSDTNFDDAADAEKHTAKGVLFFQIDRINQKISEGKDFSPDIQTLEIMLQQFTKRDKKFLEQRRKIISEYSEKKEDVLNSIDMGSSSEAEADKQIKQLRDVLWLKLYTLLMNFINKNGWWLELELPLFDDFPDSEDEEETGDDEPSID